MCDQLKYSPSLLQEGSGEEGVEKMEVENAAAVSIVIETPEEQDQAELVVSEPDQKKVICAVSFIDECSREYLI